MPSVRELFATIGMDVDTTGFIKAELAVAAIKGGLLALKDGLVNTARGFGNLILESAKTADDIGDLAARTGVGVEELQRLGYGAKLSGVGMEELSHAMNFMARKGVKDVQGGLEKLADDMAKLPPDGSRARLAMERLGRSGARLVPFLNKGSAEVRRLAAEADALGVVMSKDEIAKGGEFSDTWDALTMAFQAAGRSLAFEFIPDLLKVARGVLEWVKANRGLIKQKIQALAHGIAEGFSKVAAAAKGVWRLLRPVRSLFEWMANKMGSVNVVLALLAAIILGPVVAAIGTLIGSLSALTLAQLAAMALPLALGALFLLLAGLIFLFVEDIQTYFEGGESVFGDFIFALQELGTQFAEVFSEMWRFIKALGMKIWEAWTWPFRKAYEDIRALVDKTVGYVTKAFEVVNANPLLKMALANLVPGGQLALGIQSAFGGGASPAASVALSPTRGPPVQVDGRQLNAPITVNATPGMDEAALAGAMRSQLEDFWDSQWRQTHAATGAASSEGG